VLSWLKTTRSTGSVWLGVGECFEHLPAPLSFLGFRLLYPIPFVNLQNSL
jgi:hypothetical protein